MSIPQPYDTGLTEEQLAEAFRRALGDMTDEEIENAIATAINLIPKGLVYRGAYNYFSELPTNAELGEVYTVKYKGTSGTEPDGNEYAWGEYEGTLQWISLGVDAYTKNEIDALHEEIQQDVDANKSDISKAENDNNIIRNLLKLLLGGTTRPVTINGSFDASGGTTNRTNRIRTETFKVNAGDIVEIVNGSLVHGCGIWKGSVATSNNIRNDNGTINTNENVIIEHDGYMLVVFLRTDNADLTPDDFDGSVTLYKPIQTTVSE